MLQINNVFKLTEYSTPHKVNVTNIAVDSVKYWFEYTHDDFPGKHYHIFIGRICNLNNPVTHKLEYNVRCFEDLYTKTNSVEYNSQIMVDTLSNITSLINYIEIATYYVAGVLGN